MSSESMTGIRSIVPRKVLECVFTVLILLVLVSCTNDGKSGGIIVNDGQAAMAFTAPSVLLQSRLVVEANLILEITIEGRTVRVPRNSDGEYILQTTAAPNTRSIVVAEWFELIGDRMLQLATASRTLNVGSVSSPATLNFSAYNTEIDDDEDGVSNLRERQDGTDFDNVNEFATAPVIVTLDVLVLLPSELEDAPDDVRSEITAQALVNDEPIILSREGDEWRGLASVTESSDPLVTVQFFATAEQSLQLAEASVSENVGQGTEIVIQADAYDVDSFDDDNDTFSNAQELVEGSDPLDPRDPDDDQDGVADEADNCPADPNVDQADIDNDDIGDVCDPFNNLVDPDEDGISNFATPPDNCASISNPNQSDADGDGIGDACELPNVAPIANAGPNQTIVEGAAVELDGSASTDSDGTVASYQWLEDDEELATGESPTIAGLMEGAAYY